MESGTYNDGDVEDHPRDVLWRAHPQRIDQLPQRRPQRIGQGRQRSGSDAPAVRKPQIRVRCRRGEHKRLRKADEDLAHHGAGVDAAGRLGGAGVADPVADDEQRGGADEAVLEAAADDPDADGEDGDEGEEEGGAEPVDGGRGDVVVGRGVADDGCVGEPLKFTLAFIYLELLACCCFDV